jgi:hypothetical protein
VAANDGASSLEWAPELPPPDLTHQEEMEELYVLEPEFARTFLVGEHEPSLEWHAAELFSQIDPDRYSRMRFF